MLTYIATYTNGQSVKRRFVVAVNRARAYALARRVPPAGFSALTHLHASRKRKP